MKKLLALFTCLLLTGFLFAQNFQHPTGPVLGACNYDPNNPNSSSKVNPNPQNGNGTLGQTFNLLKCGLNFVQASNKLGQRFTFSCCPSTNGVVQPAAYVISGIPACAVIEKAYVWAGTSGNGQAVTLTVTNPLLATASYPMPIIGSGPDKCWSAVGTYTYRADVTASVTGNGTYLLSGLPVSASYPIIGSDCDGATLMIIYSDPTAAYRGHIIIHDGCVVVNGGTTTQTVTGINACAQSSSATAFCINADLQQIGMSFTLNTNAPFTNVPVENWWNYTSAPTTITNGQPSANFTMNNFGDCYNFLMAGIYYQTTNCVVCTSTLALTQVNTPATCSLCNGSATITATGGTAPYTYNWAPSGGTNATATGLCPGTYTVTVHDASGCLTSTIVVTITTNSTPLTLTPTTVSVLCNGQCNGTASVVVTGGTAPYTYVWSPSGGSAATATGLCAGTYTCTSTDAHGCTGTTTVTVTQPTVLTATQSQVNILCNGTCNGTASVVASGGTPAYTYAWAPSGGNTANATGLCAGNYSCTITDSHGCTVQKTFVITQPPALTATNTQVNILCNGSCTGTATATGAGGTPAYTYSWTTIPSQSTQTATGLCAGTYSCIVKDANNCTVTTIVTITQPPALTVTTTQVNILCNGSCTGTSTVTPGGGTPAYSYSWTTIPSQATQTATGLCAGTYSCIVKDANNCTITATVTITQPPALTVTNTHVNVLCNGSCTGTATATGAGGTPAYTYSWTTIPSQSTQTATGLCAGTYSCIVKDANNCTVTTIVTITQPTAITLTISSTQSTCSANNGTATVVATGGTPAYTYAWAPSGGTNATATGIGGGSYTVTVTDANGCIRTATIVVTTAAGGTAAINTSVNVLCFGGNNGSATVTMTGGTAPFTYVWAPSGGTNATATGLTAGTYTVTVTDANGCIASATITISQPTVLAATSTSTNILCNGVCIGSATVTASGGTAPYTYAWAPSGGNAAIATGLCAGTYTCTITDAHGCFVTQNFTITQPTLLTSTQSQVNILCNGVCNGTATVTPSGGTAPYTYAWAPSGGNAATATGLCAGTYTCTIADANGCTITKNFTITQPTLLTATTTTIASNCGTPSGSAIVTANGGVGPYTYLWTPSNQTTANATGLVSGSYTCVVTDANGCTVTVIATVNNNAAGVATIPTHVNVTCFGLCNGTATSLMTGGQAPYTYSWTTIPSQSTITATGLCAGNYNVIITDANGCSSTATVTITQPTQVVVTLGPPTSVLCNGGNNGSVTATGAGGTGVITYLWTPSGQTTATATGLGSGTYTVVVTDANGCTAQTTITITQPTVLTATSTQVNVLCNGNTTGSATVTASGGTTPYTYFWNPNGQTTNVATGLGAGTYTCTTTDANGCTVNTIVTITEPPLLNLVLSFTQSTCGNPNGSATATVTGGNPPYTYAWSNLQTTPTATGLLANTYTITVTDANGCSITNNVTVPNAGSPSAVINISTNVSCFNGNNGSATVTVTGGTAPYTYAWSPSGGNAVTATGLSAATYTVTVTDANGCSTTATVVITQPPLLLAPITGSINVLCNNGNNATATVTASGGTPNYTYMWIPSVQTNATATGLTAGTYSCTVTDANGCTVQSTITITQPTPLTIAVAGFNATCNGVCNGQVVCIPAGGTPPYAYSWAPSPGTTPSITGVCPGVYTCYITDANGCLINDTGIVQQPTPIILATNTTTAHCNQADGSATVTASGGTPGYTYLWSNGQTTTTATGLFPVTYTIVVTDFNGCTMSTTVTVPNTPGVVASTTGTTNATCFGNCDGTATVLATGGVAPYTYAWNTIPVQVTTTATGLCAGTYTCTITDASGCTSTTTATISQPVQLVLNPIGAQTICIGQSATLNATATGGTPAYTFNWNPGNLNGSTVTVSPTVTTTYTVTVTDVNNCTAINQTVTITVNPPLNVIANGATAICIGNAATITCAASGGNGGPYTYVWTPGNMNGTSLVVSPTITTIYTVTVTDNCTTLPATDTVTIVVNPLPVVTFTTNPSPAEGCAPLCVTFNSTTPNSATCNWDFQVGTATNDCNPTFCFNTPGSYDITLSVVDNNGCSNSLLMPALVHVWPNPIADFTFTPQPTTIMNALISFTDQSQLANTWSWDFGDMLGTSTVQNPTYTYGDSGNYVVTLWVTSIHGCRDSIQKTLRIDPDFAIYVPNAFTPNENGLNETFFPKGTGIDENRFKMWIFDRWGSMIWFSETWGKGWDGHANDGSDIAQEDVYVWKIEVYDYLNNKHTYLGHVSLIK